MIKGRGYLVDQQFFCRASDYKILRFDEVKSKLFEHLTKAVQPQLRHGTTEARHIRHRSMHRYTVKLKLREMDKGAPRGSKRALYLQAFVNSDRIRIPLDYKVSETQWDAKAQIVIYPPGSTKQQRKEVDDDNIYLQSARAKAVDIFTRHRLMDKSLTGEEFKRLYKDTANHLEFTAFAEREIIFLKPLRAENTIKSYRNTLRKLRRYRPTMMFHELNFEFVSNFDRWLKVTDKQDVNSIWKHHRNIKFFINQAAKKGIIITSPYKQFKAKMVHSERPYLPTSEVVKLLKIYDDNELPFNLHRSLRLFLFSCFTSLRISDVFALSQSINIADNEITFIPVKSRNKRNIVRIPITDIARKFILSDQDKIFPLVSEKQVNLDLKEIARRTGLKNKKLSFHIARHTFAMMYLETPENKVEVLQTIMGHARIDTTMIYVHIRGEAKAASMKRMNQYAQEQSQLREEEV